jgi:hypothetical protein
MENLYSLPSLPYGFYTSSVSTLLLLLTRNKEGNKETLNKPKAEKLAGAFGALFSLLCVRFITRGSLFIGDPWA